MPVLFSGSRAVPQDFLTVHSIGADVSHQASYVGDTQEPANYKVGGHRLYGMVHPSEALTSRGGAFNWSHYDKVIGKIRSAGTPLKLTYVNFNWPFQTAGYDGGAWTMSLPDDRAEWERFVLALFTRYPEIGVMEVANEVFAPNVGGFWRGSVADLTTFSNWCLDMRAKILATTGRSIEVWAPSIPGFYGNHTPYLNWLGGFARRMEFDAVPAHFYFATWRTINQPAGNGNGWVCPLELRAGLNSIGMSSIPIADNEHGFGGGIDPDTLYNTAVYEATVMGYRNLALFSTSQIAQDEAYIGAPAVNANFRGALESAAAAVNGRVITQVVDNGSGRFSITYATSQTQVDPVTIIPGTTTSATPVQVTLTTPTAGATIRYTLDWSAPSATNGVTYSAPFTVNATTKVKAIAIKSGMTDSVVREATITIAAAQQAASPTATPAAGAYGSAQTVTLATSTAGASIRYTTDGSTPTDSLGTLYTGPFAVSSSMTVRAVAYGAGMTTSAVSSTAYTINIVSQQVAHPVISPVGGTFTAPLSVSITTTTPGATILYTLGNGSSDPAINGAVYPGSLSLQASASPQVLRAVAVKIGMITSGETAYTFTVNAPASTDVPALVAAEVSGQLNTRLPGAIDAALTAQLTSRLPSAVDAEVSRQLSEHLPGMVSTEVASQLGQAGQVTQASLATAVNAEVSRQLGEHLPGMVHAEVAQQLAADLSDTVISILHNTPLHGQLTLPLVVSAG